MERFPCPRAGEFAAVNISRFHCSSPSPSQDPGTEPARSPAAERSEPWWGCRGPYAILASPSFLFPFPSSSRQRCVLRGPPRDKPLLALLPPCSGSPAPCWSGPPWGLLQGQRGAGGSRPPGTPAEGRGDLCLCHPLCSFESPRSPWELQQKTTFLAIRVRGYRFTISKKMCCLHWCMPVTACRGGSVGGLEGRGDLAGSQAQCSTDIALQMQPSLFFLSSHFYLDH